MTESAGNGVTTTYSYEEDTLRLSGISSIRSSDDEVLQALGYAYDPVGNVTTVSDATVSAAWFRNQSTGGARTFTYDALYQLVSATGRENASNGAQSSVLPTDDSQYLNYTRSYTYDDSSNLTTLTHTGAVNSTMSMVTDTTSNRSIRQNNSGGLTPATVNWDDWFTPGGQLRSLQTEGGKPASGYTDTADALTWDRNTRLQSVTLVSRSTTDVAQNDREMYQYRAGMRVRKQTRTLTNKDSGLWTVNEVRYLSGLELRNSWQETVSAGSTSAPSYSEQLEVVTTQAGRCQIRVLHWASGLPDGIGNDQIRYGVDDNIGSMQLELDSTGQIISREEYYPFGGTAVWSARSQTEADYKVIRYSGQERDGTGLYYYGYRYYAPWLCRWTASDPAGEVDGLNLFRMVRNNPVTLIDNAGLTPTKSYESKRHNESEGESESEDPTIVYRALRPDEDPQTRGLLSPPGSDPSKPASSHVQAGTRAKVKSAWVSATRSVRTAGAWAAKDGEGRVAKIKIPSNMPKEFYHDLTTPQGIRDVFNVNLPLNKITPPGERRPQLGVNFATSSKEVLLKGGVPPSAILAIYKAEKISESDYNSRGTDAGSDAKYLKARSQKTIKGVNQRPYPVRLTEISGNDTFSNWTSDDFYHDYVNKAQRLYDSFSVSEQRIIKEKIGSPYELDDISDKVGYQRYKAQIVSLFDKRR
jgi:RHS repeat-associated protein